MKVALEPQVTLRGTRDGVLIVLGEGAWEELMSSLQQQLARPNAAAFFRGARVSVETGNRFVTEPERNELEHILDAHNIRLGTTAAGALKTENLQEASDTVTRQNGPVQGQFVEHPGPVVVYGDVNDGAEIIATGDVLIFGKLRGLVHAGAGGDDHATVGALSLTPPQLRIGKHIARAPEGKKKKPRGPEMALVRDGQIVIEPWRV
jgi:septum site-determining protein MinC